jgi:acyl-CoA synthetase (AMP-forming)/AMP-acid ligase II
VDDGGYLTVTGRKDNMFVSGGENIQPEEIEAVLMQMGGIDQVMVIPVDHPEYGKRPLAFIKIREEKIQDARRKDGKKTKDKRQKIKDKKFPLKRNRSGEIFKFPEERLKEVTKYLEKNLPKYMIPDYFYSWPEEENSDQGMKANRQIFQKIANNLISEILPPNSLNPAS